MRFNQSQPPSESPSSKLLSCSSSSKSSSLSSSESSNTYVAFLAAARRLGRAREDGADPDVDEQDEDALSSSLDSESI